MRHIPLIKPYITQELKDKVCEVLDSGYLTEGPVTKDLESAFCDYIGCRFSLAVTSCTTGLEMALRALKIGPGDEVIVPDYTYPATADAVAIVGAKIILVDVDPTTMLVDYDAVSAAVTPSTKAIIPVSLFGNPLDYDQLDAIKSKYGLYIVEDAACSIGAQYRGARVGGLADISVFSLHPRKFITTGEGGMITTDNRAWAEWMLSYKHFGMKVKDNKLVTDFEHFGTNYKLSNILSAIGLEQMKDIDKLLAKRTALADNYTNLLKSRRTVGIPKTIPYGEHSFQSYCIIIENRDHVMQSMRDLGIEVQIGSYALHMHKAFSDGPHCKISGRMIGSKKVFEQCMALPLYHELSSKDQEYIVKTLVKIIGEKE